jgi:hypothetical protein
MAERIRIGYKRLFEVRILHHYWLDFGSAVFDTLPENRKNKLLLTYDSGTFLAVSPTTSTANKLKALKGVFKSTALGFVVAVPETTVIPANEVFTFCLKITDADFFNYTSLTFISRNIYELYYPVKDKILRFKENVPVFSNLTGASRGANPNKSLFLSAEIPAPAASDKVEFLNISGGALGQLTSSQPGAVTQQISAVAANMPVFVHQNDTPVLIPPAGLAGTPEKGILLTEEIPDNVFGIINISATNPADADFNCISGGSAKAICPVFQIRFKNRSAFWRYLNKSTGVQTSESGAVLPLTALGNAGVNKRKPSDPLIKVQFESNDPTKRIEKIYTEIFE